MNAVFSRLLTSALVLCIPRSSHSQLLEENFNYVPGSLLTANGYSAHSGSGATPLTVSAGSLSRSGYPSSGIGNSILVTGGSGSREDVNKTFSPISSGSVYASFLVSVATMSATGDYFFHFGPTSVSTIFRGRVLAKSDVSGQIAFGVAKSTSVDSLIHWTPFSYATGQTYLIILKYTFNGGSTSDDEVRLWVNPSTSPTEPAPDLLQTDTGSDIAEVGSFVLRQGSVSYSLTLDGIRISTGWSSARLPLQLSSLTAMDNSSGTIISWTTLSETNIYGFEVERSTLPSDNFAGVSGLIPGHGTTTLPQSYSFKDTSTGTGKFYRLREIDLDQSFYFSETVEAGLTAVAEKERLVDGLQQNFPNPFNPVTTIRYQLARSARTTLVVYDILGNEVETLVEGIQGAGSHSATWNAAGRASGTYFSVLRSGERMEVRRMLVLK